MGISNRQINHLVGDLNEIVFSITFICASILHEAVIVFEFHRVAYMFKSVSGSDFISCCCNLPSLVAANTCMEELHNT